MSAGLLIVNADDWGLDAKSTDAIVVCWQAGSVTGASAMVYMEDSARAARIARRLELPLGLHLNLIRPYTDPRTPAAVRERQRRLVRYLERARWRRWVPNPLLYAEVRRCVEDQRGRFAELYGREPTHVDGEQHMHTWPDVLLSLPRGTKVRLTWTHVRGEKPAWNRTARWAFNAWMRRRFATTTYMVSIRHLEPRFGGAGLAERLALSRRAPVEVIVHPGYDDERALLLSEDWQRALRGHRLGSYADLSA